jgi:hypothetical protein
MARPRTAPPSPAAPRARRTIPAPPAHPRPPKVCASDGPAILRMLLASSPAAPAPMRCSAGRGRCPRRIPLASRPHNGAVPLIAHGATVCLRWPRGGWAPMAPLHKAERRFADAAAPMRSRAHVRTMRRRSARPNARRCARACGCARLHRLRTGMRARARTPVGALLWYPSRCTRTIVRVCSRAAPATGPRLIVRCAVRA